MAVSYTTSADATIRAGVLRDIIRGSYSDGRPLDLRLEAVRVVGGLDLDGLDLPIRIFLKFCQLDNLSMHGSRVQFLELRAVQVASRIALAGIRTSQSLILAELLLVNRSSKYPIIDLSRAQVGGNFSLHSSTIKNSDGPALELQQAAIAGSFSVWNHVHLEGNSRGGALSMPLINVEGHIIIRNVWARNIDGPAIDMGWTETRGLIEVSEVQAISHGKKMAAFEASGLSCARSLSISNVMCVGQHHMGAQIQGATVEIGVYIRDSTFKGGPTGEGLALSSSKTPTLFMKSCHVNSKSDYALVIGAMDVAQTLSVVDSFIEAEATPLFLAYSRAGSGIDFAGSRARSRVGKLHKCDHEDACSHFTVDLRVVTTSRIYLPPSLASRTGGIHPSSWNADGTIDTDGMAYSSLGRHDAGCSHWLQLLRRSPVYSAQPYQQLAEYYRRSGHHDDARTVLIEQRKEIVRRHLIASPWRRLAHRIVGLTVGYGYQAWRAAACLIIVLALSQLLSVGLGSRESQPGRPLAAHTAKMSDAGQECSLVERVGLGIDRSLPVLNTGMRDRCDYESDTPLGQTVTGLAWLLQFLGWAFATLLVVSYTGLVRKL
ncbi:hypothetical protein ABZ328_30420 [Micromonospora aurantiaca]|uniref:hypothetical protein n=1 Tax=Micromonospora aurantiaca (nom. illeg.) TaxID=47850 RepID=UPI0033D3DE3B